MKNNVSLVWNVEAFHQIRDQAKPVVDEVTADILSHLDRSYSGPVKYMPTRPVGFAGTGSYASRRVEASRKELRRAVAGYGLEPSESFHHDTY